MLVALDQKHLYGTAAPHAYVFRRGGAAVTPAYDHDAAHCFGRGGCLGGASGEGGERAGAKETDEIASV